MTVVHTEGDAEQYRLIRAGDIDARNKMAERHMALVKKVVTYYAKRNPLLDMDDLIQEGRIGVIVALEKFDVDAGYRFSTYAMHWIKHYVQRYVVSNHSRAASTSKKDTEAYIARRMAPEDVALYERRCLSHLQIEYMSDGRCIADTYPSDEEPLEDAAESMMQWELVRNAMFHDSITPHQRLVLCMKYGILGFTKHQMGEIAQKLGVTKQAISAAEKSGLYNLRKILSESQ